MGVPFEEEVSQGDNEDASPQRHTLMDSPQNQEEGSLKRAGEDLDNVEKKRLTNEAPGSATDDLQKIRRDVEDLCRKHDELELELENLKRDFRELAERDDRQKKQREANKRKLEELGLLLQNINEKYFREPRKYEELYPEVRKIIPSFTDMKTLFAYAQCSKECNKDIQKFKKPHSIILQDDGNGILVGQMFSGTEEPTMKKFEYTDRFSMMRAIKQHIQKICLYFDKTATGVHINMRTWPTEIVSMAQFAKTRNWDVRIYQSMYDDFLNFARTKQVETNEDGNLCEMNLYLQFCNDVESRVTMTPEFFQCDLIDDLDVLWINANFRINTEDFVDRYFRDLTVRNWNNWEAIRQKVGMTDEKNWQIMKFDLRQSEDPRFKLAELFPRERFELRYITRYCKFKISPDVHGKICEKGKYLKLKVVDDWNDPYENDPFDTDAESDGEEDIRTDDEMELEIGGEIDRMGPVDKDDEAQIIFG